MHLCTAGNVSYEGIVGVDASNIVVVLGGMTGITLAPATPEILSAMTVTSVNIDAEDRRTTAS
eukprot:17561-Eustigmatos_ZCMA.PRE.1